MEIINKITTFMHTADKVFWHGKMETNSYFATLSVLFALLAGIVTYKGTTGTREWLAESFLKWNIYPSLLAATGVLFVLFVLNVCESIFGAKTFFSGLLRSLWMAVAIVFAFMLGFVAYKIMTIVLLLMVALLLVHFVGNLIQYYKYGRNQLA